MVDCDAFVRVVSAIGNRGGRVIQLCAASESGSDVTERLANFKDLGTVDAARVLVWGECSLRDIAGGEVGGDLTSIEFVL